MRHMQRNGSRGLGFVLLFCLVLGMAKRTTAAVIDEETISQPGTVVNEYGMLADNAYAGTDTVYVRLPFTGPSAGPSVPWVTHLSPGDMVLIVQMQGATMAFAGDNRTYGEVTSYGSAGLYELVRVKTFDAQTGTLTLRTDCGGLRNSYFSSGHAQVVRVPEYNRLTIEAAGSVVAPAWNGEVGGVVAMRVGTLSLQGKIDVSGKGFRGGQRTTPLAGDTPFGIVIYRTDEARLGGEKGEGVVGSAVEYDAMGGRYGRGAAANGGGGGNALNAAGGGGANGNIGRLWNGYGVMDSGGGAYSAAWALDPRFQQDGQLTQSSGGGAGGYSQSLSNEDAAVVPPGATMWLGDLRREAGGRGGRPVSHSPFRLLLGGGGGAGHQDGSAGGRGGAGGGLVVLFADAVDGAGEILAQGEAGENAVQPSSSGGNDGAGGGGAGGTVLIRAKQVAGIVIRARGGVGGQQVVFSGPTQNEAEGPGGGGGGGYVALPLDSNIAVDVAGGGAGTTNAAAVTEFPLNGATGGAMGAVDRVPDFLPTNPGICLAADLQVQIIPEADQAVEGEGFTYTMLVKNLGPDPVVQVPFSAGFSPAMDGVPWSCLPASACGSPNGRGTIQTFLTLGAGDTAAFALVVTSPFAVPPDRVLRYTAAVQIPSGVRDPNSDNNTAQLQMPVVSSAVPTPSGVQGTQPARSARLAGGGLSCQVNGGVSAMEGAATWLCMVVLLGIAITARMRIQRR